MYFRKSLCILIVVSFLYGCATVNFSANYYNPPTNYKVEVNDLFNELKAKLGLKYDYAMSIVSDDQCRGIKGIPEILGTEIHLPENLIKYIYQNYYDNRNEVLISTLAHEICHTEFSLLDQETPQAHFLVDNKAIELMHKLMYTATDYYKSLFVLRNYWFARKRMGGHALNSGWNLVNLASLAFVGVGFFKDWYSTDISTRMKLCSGSYKIKDRSCFGRSKGPE